jgi:hypothetical protein
LCLGLPDGVELFHGFGNQLELMVASVREYSKQKQDIRLAAVGVEHERNDNLNQRDAK